MFRLLLSEGCSYLYLQISDTSSITFMKILLCFLEFALASPALVLALSVRKSALIMNEIAASKIQIIHWESNKFGYLLSGAIA